MNPDVIYVLGDLANLSAIPALVLFIVFYLRGSKWRDFPAGRALMYIAVALGFTVSVSSLVVIFGDDYQYREWVRLALFTAISVTVWRLFVVLRQVQKRPPRTVEELQAMIDALMIAQREHPGRRKSNDSHEGEE